MADHAEMIHQQMEETRSNLAEKLDALESQVSETVQNTTTAVSDTVAAVKDTVENVTDTVKETVEKAAETVQSVGKVLDLRHQTEQHPWLIFGGSVALGFAAAQLFGGSREKGGSDSRTRASQPNFSALAANGSAGNGHQATESSTASQPRAEPATEGPKGWLWEQLGRLKGLAIGSMMGVVREVAGRNLPGSLGQRVAEEVDRLTTHLGGEPMPDPLGHNESHDSPSGNKP